MEENIANGFIRVIPSNKLLYCVGNLKQRDKTKLDSLMAKGTASAAEKSKDLERHIRRIKG